MRQPAWLNISLARKISLLFGTAVLLTILATLSFPWAQMQSLSEQVMLEKAKGIAHAAHDKADLYGTNWNRAQLDLDVRWPVVSRQLSLPAQPPQLVSVATPIPGHGFRTDAQAQFQRSPNQTYFFKIQDDGRIFRLAMAIRSLDTDPHPHVLRGMIDVKLAMERNWAVWNDIITVLAGASGAVLAILIFYLVTQRLVLSKVSTLREVAEQVITGDINVRARIASGDEFQALAEAFNDMLTHLKDAQDDLHTINRSLDVKLEELAQTNVNLYEANRLKTEFLSNVSHELRTPLVSIIGFAELLHESWENPDADRQRLARFAQNILTSGRSLLDIINDLLDLAKIEAGRMEVHLSEFIIADLCRDLIDFVRPLADKRDQKLGFNVTSDLPDMNSDSGKIKQILYNLLSNAIKFTPRGGTITLTVERAADSAVKLLVCDTGPGIAEELQSTIFEQFCQLDASRTREHEGTGLGLTITRELAEILGGHLSLESEPGKGATFIVELPAMLERTEAPAKVRSS